VTTRRALTTRTLVGALHFMVSGGPYGLEELLSKAGAWGAVLVLLVTPVFWSLPTALMVGELGAALPEEGGYYVWVKRALGPLLGFQEAWLSLAASVFDMAIYPTLFVSYLARFWPVLGEAPWATTICVSLIATCALLNMLGAKSVGESSVAMTVLLLLPFAALTVALLVAAPGAPARATAPGGADLLGGVLVAMWNYMGWDNASTVAGEVERPQTTYPRAAVIAVTLVALTYVVPVGAVALAHVDVSGWETGGWVDLGDRVGGVMLRGGLVLGGMMCGFGMLNALVLSYSRVPVALALDGHLPPSFARLSKKNEAPVVAIVACACAWTLSLGLKFERLVALDILLYGSALVLEFVALVVLRVREPDLARPYRIPGGVPGTIALSIPPVLLLGVALWKNTDGRVCGMNALAFGLLVIAAGPVAYWVSKRAFSGARASNQASMRSVPEDRSHR
jgi:amino acid transporter